MRTAASRHPEPTRKFPSPDIKVLVAATGLVALVLIGVALAIVFVAILGSAAGSVEQHARYSSAIDAAALHAKGMANNERGFLIDGDEGFIAQLEGRAELVRAAFAAALEAADASQRSTVAEAREGFERWLGSVEEEIALYRAGDEEAAIEMSLGPARDLRWAYEGWLADAAALGVAGFQNASASVGQTSLVSLTVLLVYLVLAAVAAGVVALWVIHTVLRPTYALVRALADAEESTPSPVS